VAEVAGGLVGLTVLRGGLTVLRGGLTVLAGGAGCAAVGLGEGWVRVVGAGGAAGVFGVGAGLGGGAGCSAVGLGKSPVLVAAGVFGLCAGLGGGAGCSAVGLGKSPVLGAAGVFGLCAGLGGGAGCSAVGLGKSPVLGALGVLGSGAGTGGVEGRDTPGVGIVRAGVLLRSGRPSIRPTARASSSAPRSSAPTGSALRRRWMPGAGTDDPSRGAGTGGTGPSRGTGGGGASRTVVTPVVGGVSSRNQVETSAAVGRWSGSAAVIACSRAGIGVGRSWGTWGWRCRRARAASMGWPGYSRCPVRHSMSTRPSA